jgi:hypothetical protein
MLASNGAVTHLLWSWLFSSVRGISVGIPVYIAVVMTITLRRASASYDEAA